ncbi:MAG TPA: hypothetical protein PK604_15120 [Acetivibrio clariflavus]|nr:hypothetical protein [Acetivibrio clariflavus]
MECRACYETTDQEFLLCHSCQRKKESSKFRMIFGLVCTLLGIAGSFASYYSAVYNINSNRRYTIFYGFVICSFIMFIKAYADWSYYRKKEKEIKQYGNIMKNNDGINEDALKRYLNSKKD